METKIALLNYLAGGKFHSGEFLASALGISRTAVWKQVHALADNYGLDIYAVRGKGYRLSRPIELLDRDIIKSAITKKILNRINHIDVLFDTDSTNQQLLNKISVDGVHGHVTLAEFQSSGRGRRGKSWISPLGSGISMSIGWHFEIQPDSLTALSLAAGVAVVKALQKMGINDVHLKWPNDIICRDRKLAGMLIESSGETAGPYDVVLGIGMNVNLPAHIITMIDQPVIDLAGITAVPLSRNRVAGTIISEITGMFDEFGVHGFAAFIEQWRKLDYLFDKQATLLLPNETVSGRVVGIDENGMLKMSINGKAKLFSGGDLSLRMRQ